MGSVRLGPITDSDLLEAFANPSTPAKLSAESAGLLSDTTRKKILGLKQTRKKVVELLEEIEISLDLTIRNSSRLWKI